MKMLHRAARLIPPIARLHDDRNRLSRELARIQTERAGNFNNAVNLRTELGQLNSSLDSLNAECNQWKWKFEALQREVQADRERKTAGRSFEFDYGYHPRVRDWSSLPKGNTYAALIAKNEKRYVDWLTSFKQYSDRFASIPAEKPASEAEPFWDNGWFAPLDGICLYGLITKTNPRTYVEVGSGNSTKFVRRAIVDHGLRTRVVSIDPYPRAVIDELCDEVIRVPFEDIDIARFVDLDADDVMFVDNSHRSFQNSDVTVFFTEVLPHLKPGVIWSVHDIFLPNDYPAGWEERMYNEQYLLMTYLAGGGGNDTIELPVAYLAERPELTSELVRTLPSPHPWHPVPLIGGAFWMRKD